MQKVPKSPMRGMSPAFRSENNVPLTEAGRLGAIDPL
jgi:hypothetical protein